MTAAMPFVVTSNVIVCKDLAAEAPSKVQGAANEAAPHEAPTPGDAAQAQAPSPAPPADA